tara:strand:- start:486 stop:707 length:222 start_codon:yes stop_codon:yes gene_type:complete
MKRLLLLPLIVGLTTPFQARPPGGKPDLKVGQCTETSVQMLFTSLSKEYIGDDWEAYGVVGKIKQGSLIFQMI